MLGMEGDDDLTRMYLQASYLSVIVQMNVDDSFDCFKDNRDDNPW
jgi:hypothetical protein